MRQWEISNKSISAEVDVVGFFRKGPVMEKVFRVSLVLFFVGIIFCGCRTEGISIGSGEECVYKLSERGFVRDWLVAGPFPNPVVSEKLPDGSSHLGFYKDYLESVGGESEAVLSSDMEIVFTDEDGVEG